MSGFFFKALVLSISLLEFKIHILLTCKWYPVYLKVQCITDRKLGCKKKFLKHVTQVFKLIISGKTVDTTCYII